VVGHGGKEMSQQAISERVERAQRRQLRELFGTDDIAKAKEIAERGKQTDGMTPEDRKEFERLKRVEEARARSRQTQEQRVQQTLQTKEQRISELETELKQVKNQQLVQQQDATISNVAAEFIDGSFLKYARRELQDHIVALKNSDPDALKKFGPKDLKKFFQKLATEQPAFAKKPEEASTTTSETETTKPSVVRRPVTSGKGQPRPPNPPVAPDGPGMYKGKTIRPGQPNSMSNAELRAYMRETGQKLPY
jgi:hypothetical protein